MKKILVLLIVSIISTGAFAQHDSTGRMKSGKNMQGKDCVMMKDGKMMVKKNDQTMAMNSDMTMSNGTVVMTNGTVKMQDGTLMTLKEGDCVYMNGKVGKMGKMKMGKMKKDSV